MQTSSAPEDMTRPMSTINSTTILSTSRGFRWGWCSMLLVLLAMTSGCAAFRPVYGVPARFVPVEFLGPSRSGKQTIDLSLLRQSPPAAHLVDANDLLSVYVEGVLGRREEPPPVHFPQNSDIPPTVGFPIPVRDDGTISLPLVGAVSVRGLTIRQVEDVLRRAYTVDHAFLQPGRDRIFVALQQPRTFNILVIRQEASSDVSIGSQGELNLGALKRGTGRSVNLPVYKNDVLNALAETGGLPGLDAENAIYIIRGRERSSVGPTPVGYPPANWPAGVPSGQPSPPQIPAPGAVPPQWQPNMPPAPQSAIHPRDAIIRGQSPSAFNPQADYRFAARQQLQPTIVQTGGWSSPAGQPVNPSLPYLQVSDTGPIPGAGQPTPLPPAGLPPIPQATFPPANSPQPSYPQPSYPQNGAAPSGMPVPGGHSPAMGMPQGVPAVPEYTPQPAAPMPAVGGWSAVPPAAPLPPALAPYDANWNDANTTGVVGQWPVEIDERLNDRHIIRIPVRLGAGERANITESDIILQDGDIVFIESRETEVFYTGGLLGGGQYTLPRDYDLDALGAIAIAQGRSSGGGSSRATQSQGGQSALNNDVSISASQLIVLRPLPDGGQLTIQVDLYEAIRNPNERIIIQPGDYLLLQYTRCEAVMAFVERHLLEGALFGLAAAQLNQGR